MKTITSNYVRLFLLALFWVLAFHGTARAQTGTYISWNYQVGCISYDSDSEPDDHRKELLFLDDIENSPCVRVCPNTAVSYVVHGTNITNVLWSAAGGTVSSVSGPNNTVGNVTWGATGNAALDVTIIYANNTQRNITLCIEIINGPQAKFDVVSPNGQPQFCLEDEVLFENISSDNGGSDIVNYYWQFGDGEVSYEFEPTHAYTTWGWHTIKLTVTNNCGCSDTYSMEVYISEKPSFTISCPSVVCENDEKYTYTVDSECGGEWVVTGGTIVSQTGTSVMVVWNNVDADGFGYISYRSECACDFWTTVKIPVIKKVGTIMGETTICLGDQGLFKLPQWPTTDFNWSISPNVTGGTQLVYNDQRNQIIVDGLAPGIYILSCKYTNTLLGCSGDASIRVTVISGTVITSNQPDDFCTNSGTKTYTTTSGAVVGWQLKRNNTVLANTSGVNFTYNFTLGGVYTLTATASGGCSGDPKVITVTQSPDTPIGTITGDNKICSGVPYDYSFNNTVPNTMLVWEVLPAGAGAFQGDNTGNNVTLIFTSAVTSVRVKRISLDGLACQSGWLSLPVSQIVLAAGITANNTIHCPSSQSTFTVNNLGGITPDLLEWSVSGGGGVIAGVNGNTVTIAWNQVSGSQTVTLKVRKCNLVQTINLLVTIYTLPTLTLTVPSQICYGVPLNLTLSAPGVTSGTITWDFGNGVTQNTSVSPGGSYTFANPYNNTTTSNVNHVITATLNSPNGCNYSPQASGTVVVFPRTIITVSPGYNYIICPTLPYSTVLSANATTGIGVSVTYKWFKGTTQIGTGSTYTISNGTQGTSPQGTYYVQVTDSNNCVVNSQNIIVQASCTPVNPCNMPDPNLNVSASWSQCGFITAVATYNGTPAGVQWVGSPLISLVSSNATNATFSTATPGAHLVTVKVTYNTPNGPCTVQKTVEVRTHYKPNFNTVVTCNGGANISYNVTLLNNSTVFDVTSTDITYTFSGTGMSPQVGQTINLTGLAPGTYNYTLTLSMAGKPNCTITKTLVLAPTPSTAFTIADASVCAEQGITLNITNYNPLNTYQFFYAGTSYMASSSSSTVNFTAASGNYPVYLKVTAPGGCSFTSSTQIISYTRAQFSGNIQVVPGTAFCEGTSAAMNFTISSGSIPSGYAWMNGSTQVGTGASYSPTTSGNYWVKLYDAQGCQYTGAGSVNVIIRQRPYAGIIGSGTLCSGEQGTVQGVVTNAAMERRWLLNGSAMVAPYGTWSTTTPLTVNVPTGAGTYIYTFEVRPATDITCGSTASLSVTVYPAVTPPVVTYHVDTCEPYKVTVTASGPSSGTYNWSNGMTGQTIVVGAGGALGVTYTATTGCKASGDNMIPQPLERSLWIFPVGCYDICLKEPFPYILGPLGIVDDYHWLVNGNIPPGGSGHNASVALLPVSQVGSYQLMIHNEGCDIESGIAHIVPDPKECNVKDCEFKFEVKDIKEDGGVYFIDGYLHNPTGAAVTITIGSFNNYGTYSPSSITIAAGGTYFFNYGLTFTPNSSYPGGVDYIIIQTKDCVSVYPVMFKDFGYRSSEKPVKISIMPNPVDDITTIVYDLGDQYKQAETLTVYSLLGNPVYETKLNKPAGEVKCSLGSLPSGTYIVSIQADGVRALQQTLVRK